LFKEEWLRYFVPKKIPYSVYSTQTDLLNKFKNIKSNNEKMFENDDSKKWFVLKFNHIANDEMLEDCYNVGKNFSDLRKLINESLNNSCEKIVLNDGHFHIINSTLKISTEDLLICFKKGYVVTSTLRSKTFWT
jgi:hypothetical protein